MTQSVRLISDRDWNLRVVYRCAAPGVLLCLAFLVSCNGQQRTAAQQDRAVQQGAVETPGLKRFSSPQAVVDEHLKALNSCDFEGLMSQYPPEIQVFLPGGVVINGKEQVAEMFRGAVKPFKEGGICGVTTTPQHTFVVGDTVNVQWSANADFLAEPYLGADAYVTKDGLLWVMVSTFERDRIKAK